MATKKEWTIRVRAINERIKQDKEAVQWWKDNESKLNDPNFMPDYPLSERLPFLENHKAFEEELKPVSSRLTGMFKEEIYDTLTVYYENDLLTAKEKEIYELYYNTKKTVKSICWELGIKLSTFQKRKRRLVDKILGKE